jgi:hypothetical protein
MTHEFLDGIISDLPVEKGKPLLPHRSPVLRGPVDSLEAPGAVYL